MMKYSAIRKARGSIVGVVIVGIGCAAILATVAFIGYFQLTKGSSRQGFVAQTRALLAQAAYMLVTESADSDKDGYWEAPVMDSSSGLFPTGGGRLPAASGAPKNDAWGTAIGYCSWDIGPINTSTYRIAGTVSPTQATTVFAVISAGANKAFDTTCAEMLAGTVKGDDRMLTYSNAQIVQGVSGIRYFADPVANASSLSGLSSPADGEVRLQKDVNKLMRWDAGTSSWVAVTSGPGGSDPVTPSAPRSLGLNNRLINGNFTLWQRPDPATVDTNTTARADPFIYADRWLINGSGTQRNGSLAVGSYYAKRIHPYSSNQIKATYGIEIGRTYVTANSTYPPREILAQRIDDVSSLSGNYVSYSFWIKVVAIDPGNALNFCADIAQYYQLKNGGAVSATTALAQKCYPTNGAWQQVSFTSSIPLPSVDFSTVMPNTYSLWFRPVTEPASVTQPNRFVIQIAQAQLEVGQTVSPFEERLPGLELLLAQRYYEVGTAVSRYSKDDPAYMTVFYKVRKRYVDSPEVAPTPVVKPVTNTGTRCSSVITNEFTSVDMFQVYKGVTDAVAGCSWDATWSVDAEDYR